jgi:AraC-like DNA-binding protein
MSNLATHPSLLADRPRSAPEEHPGGGGSISPLLHREVAEDSAWQVSPNMLTGWREVVAFDTAGAAIIGDFTITRSASVNVSVGNQFFIQLLLDGHDILPPSHGPRAAAGGKMLFGRLRADEQTQFMLPNGGRWRSLFIGVSDRAVADMWGVEPERLVDLLRSAKSADEAEEPNMIEYGGYISLAKHNAPEQIFSCTLPAAQRRAFIWSRSLELMIDIVSNALAESETERGGLSRSRSAVRVARDILHREIAHPHTIDSLSYRVSMTRRDFMSSFKEEFGVTFHDYYMDARMSRAASLLNETRVRVTEVSEQVGYTQLSSFSRAFKAFHGVSPCAFHETRRLVS